MKCYAYIRYSQQGQSSGSVDRQRSNIESYENKYSITIDRWFIDEGVSGFDGSQAGVNTQYTQLMNTLQAGDSIYVDTLSRWSRDDSYSAFSDVAELLKRDISLTTVSDNTTHSAQGKSIQSAIQILFHAETANKESADKRKYALATHAKKKEKIAEGIQCVIVAPPWFTLNQQTFKPKENIVEYELNHHKSTVKLIFNLCIQGLGCTLIAQHLNKNNIPTMRQNKPWSDMAVFNILKSPTVIGTYQGKEGYLTPVVSNDVFNQAQRVIEARRTMKTTRTSKEVSVLSGVAHCLVCGGKLHLTRINKNPNNWLLCYNKKKGSCKVSNIRQSDTTAALVEILLHVGSANLVSADKAAQTADIAALEGELSRLKTKQEEIEASMLSGTITATLNNLAAKVEASQAVAQAKLDQLKIDKQSTQEIEDSREYFTSNLKLDTPEDRRKANQHLLRMGVQVHIGRFPLGLHYKIKQNGVVTWEGIASHFFPHDIADLAISKKYGTCEQTVIAEILNKEHTIIKSDIRNDSLNKLSKEMFDAYWRSFSTDEVEEKEKYYQSWLAWKKQNG